MTRTISKNRMVSLHSLGMLGLATGLPACGASGGSGDLGIWTPSGAPAIESDGGPGSVGASAAGSSTTVAGSASSSTGRGGSSSAASTSASSAKASGGTAAGVPCDVASLLAAKCTSCHSDPPINGSLSGLVTYGDLTATSKEDSTRNEAQLSIVRMQSTTSPMPPASVNMPATAADIATLQNWVNGGYAMGSCSSGGGADGGTDAGATSPTGVFTGVASFTSQVGPSSHNAGQDCMGCHANGGGEAPRFAFAGTLYDGQGRAVSGAEIRVVDANGAAVSVYTGTNGNFYRSGTPLATPGKAGARNGSATAAMVSAVTKAGCNSCHCSGSSCVTTPMHLP